MFQKDGRNSQHFDFAQFYYCTIFHLKSIINSFTITSLNSLQPSPIKETSAALISPSTSTKLASPLSRASSSVSGVAATVSNQSTPSMNNDTIRLLAASGPLIQPNFPSNMPRPPMIPPNMAAAAAAGMDQANQFNRAIQAQAQMLAMCQNMPPVSNF